MTDLRDFVLRNLDADRGDFERAATAARRKPTPAPPSRHPQVAMPLDTPRAAALPDLTPLPTGTDPELPLPLPRALRRAVEQIPPGAHPRLLRLLGSLYSNRPGYQQEWAS